MNNTNNSTQTFQFYRYDAVFLGGHAFAFFLPFVVLFLLFCFRKERAISKRGIIPYLSIFGILIYYIRVTFLQLSFLKTANPSSLTRQFEKKKFFF